MKFNIKVRIDKMSSNLSVPQVQDQNLQVWLQQLVGTIAKLESEIKDLKQRLEKSEASKN